MTRADYRTRIKNKLANLSRSLPTIFPDSEINSAYLDALRSLPFKGVYKEEKWTRTLELNQKEYQVQSGTLKIEKVEFDMGAGGVENFVKQEGWEEFGGALHLAYLPSGTFTMRVWAKMKFAEVQDDVTALDIPDDKGEVLVLAAVRRLLENLIHYMIDSANYDSIVKPSGATLPQVKGWRDELRVEEERIVKSFRTTPRPRFMNLVSD